MPETTLRNELQTESVSLDTESRYACTGNTIKEVEMVGKMAGDGELT